MRTLPLEFQYSDIKITISGRDNISIRLTTLNFPIHQFHPPSTLGMVHSQNVSKRYKTSGLQKRLIRQVYKNSSKTFAKNIHILYLWKFAGSVAAMFAVLYFFLCFSFFAIPQSLLISKNDSEDSCTDVLKPDVL